MRALAVACLLLAAPLAGCLDLWDGFQNRRTAPGDSALDFIQGDRKVLVDIHYVDGAAPNPDALAAMKLEVGTLLGKSVGVRQTGGVPGKGATHRYTWSEVSALERDVRTRWTDDETAVLFMLYLDGGSEGDAGNGGGKVLGAAYHGSSTVMFKGNIRQSSTSDPGLINLDNRPPEHEVERAVLVHEFGHVLGLVNHGLAMTKSREMTDDPVPETSKNEGEGHSRNRESVMYWAVESSQILNLFFLRRESIPYKFDADDRADVAAAK